MRTVKEKHIEPGCVYCDEEHDPAIQCRYMETDVWGGGELPGPKPPKPTAPRKVVRDENGNLLSVHF